MSMKYKDFSKHFYSMIREILKNQKFLRYVHYTGLDHPLDESLPSVSPSGVFDNNMEFKHINDEVLQDRKVIVFINPVGTMFRQRAVASETYIISIVVENEHRLINGISDDEPIEFRAYKIAREIARSIDGKRIAGLGEVSINSDKAGSLTRKYDILDLEVLVHKSNARGFGDD